MAYDFLYQGGYTNSLRDINPRTKNHGALNYLEKDWNSRVITKTKV